MGSYIPSTLTQQEEMLKEAGFSSLDDLYRDVPEDLKLRNALVADSASGSSPLRYAIALCFPSTISTSELAMSVLSSL